MTSMDRIPETYLRDLDGISTPPTEKERSRLFQTYWHGNGGSAEARAQIIMTMSRFVISIANRYRHCGLPIADLIQLGNLGLVRSIDKFEPARGPFVECALWWIKQEILRGLSGQARTIRIPERTIQAMRHWQPHEAELAEELGGRPTAKELEPYTDVSAEIISAARRADAKLVSLDLHRDHENDEHLDSPLLESIPDERPEPPDEVAVRMMWETILQIVDQIPDNLARFVVKRLFGLNGSKADKVTLRMLEEETGYSRTWIAIKRDEALNFIRGHVPAHLREVYMSAENVSLPA